MRRVAILLLPLWLAGLAAGAQGITNEIFSGKLLKPDVGVWAWYDVKDNTIQREFQVRLAIVGKERIRFKTGYWLEVQIIPRVGFPAIYKMLLTGPASDSDNVHRVIIQEGQSPAQELQLEKGGGGKSSDNAVQRKSLGSETMTTASGPVLAEHFVFLDGGQDTPGQRTEIWINEEVRPMGIVRLLSPQGEFNLVRYGTGGPDAVSALGGNTPGAYEESQVDGQEHHPGEIHVQVNEEPQEEEPPSVQDRLNQRRRRP